MPKPRHVLSTGPIGHHPGVKESTPRALGALGPPIAARSVVPARGAARDPGRRPGMGARGGLSMSRWR